jgi:hypothetical protein
LLAFLSPASTSASVVESDLPGHSLFLHIKGFAAPFPGPGNYTIDFAATGHDYSITATGAVTAASGAWSFRQGEFFDSVVITLNNYFGNGTGAEIVLLNTAYYELYAGTSNQNGNWSLVNFVQDPVFSAELADVIAPEGGVATFQASLLNGASGVTFQWYKNGEALVGSNKVSIVLTGVAKANEGFYSVQVSKDSDTNVSRAAKLTVLPTVPAAFAGHGFEMWMTNNTPPPGFPATDAANAFRLKGPSQSFFKDGELTFLAEYAGAGTNRTKTGVGLFAITNGTVRTLVISGADPMPGTTSPYLNFGGFTEPVGGQFVFYGVAKSLSGALDYAMLSWNGTAATSLVANKSPIPGNDGAQFQFFGGPGGFGLDFAFGGIGPGQAAGYYQFKNGQLIELFDNNSVLPGFPAPPLNYDMNTMPSGTSALRTFALRERNTGNYRMVNRSEDGAITTLFAKNDFYPGTTMPMTQASAVPPKTRHGQTGFLLNDESARNFLVRYDAQGLHAVAKTGDTLPNGSTLSTISNFGVTDSGIIFDCVTTGGRSGIYLRTGDAPLVTVIDPLSRIGTNVVSFVSLRAASDTNIVIQASLYPSGQAGYMVNTAVGDAIQPRIAIAARRFNAENHFAITANVTGVAAVALDHSADFAAWEALVTNAVSGPEITVADPRARGSAPRDFYRLREANP